MAEDHGLSFAPILVVNLCSVFGRNRIHETSPYLEVDVCQRTARFVPENWRQDVVGGLRKDHCLRLKICNFPTSKDNAIYHTLIFQLTYRELCDAQSKIKDQHKRSVVYGDGQEFFLFPLKSELKVQSLAIA